MYLLGVFDIDNFKKYNSPPLDYEQADHHLEELGKLITEVAQEFGEADGIDRVQPFHMHGDEFLILFDSSFSNKDIDTFFIRVSGTISTMNKSGKVKGCFVYNSKPKQ